MIFKKLNVLVRGRRQAHNPTLAKILRLTYNRSCSHNRPQTAACNAVYSISRRALLITRLGEQLPRPRQVSMLRNLPDGTYLMHNQAQPRCGIPSCVRVASKTQYFLKNITQADRSLGFCLLTLIFLVECSTDEIPVFCPCNSSHLDLR